LAVKGPEIFNKWVGESERAIKEIFRKARAASPSIVFLDEIDAIATRRGGMSTHNQGEGTSVADRVLTQLLTELDGIEPLVNVTIVAATNRPDVLDPALLRPGRIDRMLYVAPPDFDARLAILTLKTTKMPLSEHVDLEAIARQSDGLSGAEMVAVCQEAALFAMESRSDRMVVSVLMNHFDAALKAVKPRISADMIAFYEAFGKSHQVR
jgi:AAA family ATPase